VLWYSIIMFSLKDIPGTVLRVSKCVCRNKLVVKLECFVYFAKLCPWSSMRVIRKFISRLNFNVVWRTTSSTLLFRSYVILPSSSQYLWNALFNYVYFWKFNTLTYNKLIFRTIKTRWQDSIRKLPLKIGFIVVN
jgi:hypothetical protein